MPGLLTRFGCCLAKPGSMGQWEGLCVTGPMNALLQDPGFAPVNTEVVMPSQGLPAPLLYGVLPPTHALHVCACAEAQQQRLLTKGSF